MRVLPRGLANAYRRHRTDGKAGPAAGTSLFDHLRQERTASAWTEADRLSRTGVATGLAIGSVFGEAVLADHRDMWEVLWPAGKDRLGTEFRASAAEGALRDG